LKNIEKKPPKPEDLVRLTDSILRTLAELSDLPTATTDLILQTLISSKISLFESQRRAFIAGMYSSASKFAEAVVILERAAENLTKSKAESQRLLARASSKSSSAAAVSGVGTLQDEDKKELEWLGGLQAKLEHLIRQNRLKAHAMLALQFTQKKEKEIAEISQGVAEMELDGSTTATTKAKASQQDVYLSDNLDRFLTEFDPANPRFYPLPPNKLEPVPMKPLFFDIAFNSVEYPRSNILKRLEGKERVGRVPQAKMEGVKKERGSQEQKKGVATEEKKAQEQGGSGLTGFLSGIWGGRK
jgi:signal recognition particle subunit SRP68